MTRTKKLTLLASFLLWACCLSVASAATTATGYVTIVVTSLRASSTVITYSVSVDTLSLMGNSAAPFYVDFQFNDGQGTGDGNNSVTLNNFAFGTGGSASGTSTVSGGASGNLSSGFTLTDTSAFNEATQGFTAGSLLTFNITVPSTRWQRRSGRVHICRSSFI